MKTPEEIKKGLTCAIDGCMEPEVCESCPYYIKDDDVMCYVSAMMKDALAYIEQLEERIDRAMIQMHGDCGCCAYVETPSYESPCSECIQSPSRPMWEYEGLPEVKEV